MNILNRPIDSLKPYPQNAKQHPEKQIKGIAESIRRFGFTQPLVIDAAGVVVIGHGRLLAAKHLKLKEVPCVTLENLTADQVKALRVLDNKLNESPWDLDLLKVEICEIQMDLSPFEIDLKGVTEEPEVEQDEGGADVETVSTSIKRGDLIELGAHRLLCGSAAEAADVIKLMNGQKALLIATDPPYGVAYTDEARVAADRVHVRPERKEKWLGGIENDQLVDEAIQPFLEDCFRAASVHALVDNAAWYLWHAHLTAAFFAAAAAAADVLLHRQIVWVKPSLLFGFGDYHWRHECCFYGWKKGFRPEFYGERNQTSVWEITHDTSNGNRIHPTQKPLEVFAIPIKNHTKATEIIYEPFSGSGSQLIAADQLGRVCYGLEIEPKYCQVIIDRYRAHCIKTGKEFKGFINNQAIS